MELDLNEERPFSFILGKCLLWPVRARSDDWKVANPDVYLIKTLENTIFGHQSL